MLSALEAFQQRSTGTRWLWGLRWAAEATIDLLSFVGRRLGRMPALVLATYRDDELGEDHCGSHGRMYRRHCSSVVPLTESGLHCGVRHGRCDYGLRVDG